MSEDDSKPRVPVRNPKRKFRKYGDTLEEALPHIIHFVEKGTTINHACELAGFCKQALTQYRQRHPDVDAEIKQAMREADNGIVRTLFEQAQENPSLGLLWLERRRPDEWGKVDRHEHTGKDGGAIQIEEISRMSDAQLVAFVSGKSEGGDGQGHE